MTVQDDETEEAEGWGDEVELVLGEGATNLFICGALCSIHVIF